MWGSNVMYIIKRPFSGDGGESKGDIVQLSTYLTYLFVCTYVHGYIRKRNGCIFIYLLPHLFIVSSTSFLTSPWLSHIKRIVPLIILRKREWTRERKSVHVMLHGFHE
jgi:hypothetical protein